MDATIKEAYFLAGLWLSAQCIVRRKFQIEKIASYCKMATVNVVSKKVQLKDMIIEHKLLSISCVVYISVNKKNHVGDVLNYFFLI